MTSSDFALLVSGISLAIAGLAFAWNVTEKFIFVKPRLQVSFGVYHVIEGGKSGKALLCLSVTNMGPGPSIIHSCIAQMRTKPFWKRQFGILNPIHNDPASDKPESIGPFSAGLPLKLHAGKAQSFYFPFTAQTFLREPVIRVGVTDTYGRKAWSKRKAVKKAVSEFREEFPDAAPMPESDNQTA